jgi:hypothetical protein
MSELKLQEARKEHRCDTCGRLIPVGIKYWRKFDEDAVDYREHTNCLDFEDQEELPAGFNGNRKRKKTWT